MSDDRAREEVLQRFRREFDSNPEYSLLDAVRPLENVVFMVGLNSSFIMQLTDYLRVKKQELRYKYLRGCGLSYEDNLVEECNDMKHKTKFCATLLEEKVQILRNVTQVDSLVPCDTITEAFDEEQQKAVHPEIFRL